jgi:arylsulfatase A-like enzyme
MSRNSINYVFRMLAAAVLACVGIGSALGADAGQAARPNVVLIVSDDQRPDTIHALGNSQIHTPHLDELVKRGTTFTRAVAPNPICTPSRAEIISGCTGFRNGVFDFGGRLSAGLVLFPQALRAAGYQTWYVGKWDFRGEPSASGYETSDGLFRGGSRVPQTHPLDFAGRPTTGYQGWTFRSADGTELPEKGVGLTPDISRRFADAAIRLLRRKADRPFFLHVNFTAPHDPLVIPAGRADATRPDRLSVPANFLPEHPFEHGNLRGRDELLWPWPRTKEIVRAELAAYYAVIEEMDEQVGRILRTLEETREAENTIVIFTSDHGLAIGSHGLRGKQNMYEHTVGVPLVMCGPGVPVGKRIDAQCYLRDIYPTVCELAQVPVPAGIDGRSLAPLLRGEVREVHPFVVGYFRGVQRMIRTDRWKLICYPQAGRVQLFNLANDPQEIADLAGDSKHQAIIAELRERLGAWQNAHADSLVLPK